MIKERLITGYCAIRENKVIIDKKIKFVQENFSNFPSLMKAIYRFLEIKYPKFYKMDNLSKLGFITAELLIKNEDITKKYESDRIGIILSNSASSLNTDSEYFDTIKDKGSYFPSPSLFVYTLPNIMAGEISIKNKIRGENIFFVSEKIDFEILFEYTDTLFKTEKIDCALIGWADMSIDAKKYESIVYLIEKSQNKIDQVSIFNTKNLRDKYLNRSE